MRKEFNRIHKMGIELEGGWDRKPEARMVPDGSVDAPGARYVGECPSPPIAEPTELEKWMRANYPTHTNRSCGMHVHVSFKDLRDYLRLMSQQAFNHIHAELGAWGKRANIKNAHFWERLQGDNTYCKKEYNPMKQVKHHDKGPARYSMLNYCYGRYQTMELRVLPLFKEVDVGVAAVAAFADILEKYLAKRRPLSSRSEMVILEESNLTQEDTEYETETLAHSEGLEVITLEDALCA
jgi:hypothetical protein